MKTLKNILFVVLVEAAILLICLGVLTVLKQFNIYGGRITQLLPFAVIMLITFLISKLQKCTCKELGIIINKEIFILLVIFTISALIPCFSGIMHLEKIDLIIWNFFYYAIVGITEELFFRGYIKSRFPNENMWVWRSVSAFAFASLHVISSEEMTCILFILLILFGFVFSLLRDWIGSIIPLLFFHSLWDFFSCYNDNYKNVLTMFGEWVVLLFVAYMYKKYRNQKKIL